MTLPTNPNWTLFFRRDDPPHERHSLASGAAQGMFFLGARRVSQSKMADASGATGALVGRRILVVEDEPLLADELMDELFGIGAVPIGPIPSVKRALQALAEGSRLDAALLNVHLRGDESFPVADDLIRRGVPFLFVTGNDAFVRQHYPTIPVHPKPSDIPLLLKALSRMMGSLGALGPDPTLNPH